MAVATAVLLLGAPSSIVGTLWPGTGDPLRSRALAPRFTQLTDAGAAADGVLCAVNVWQASLRFAGAGVQIRGAILMCTNMENADDNKRAECANKVNLVITNAVFVATGVAGAVSSCAGSINMQATCTAGVTQFVAASATLAAGACEMTQQCNLWWKSIPVPPSGVTTKSPLLPPTLPPLQVPTLPPPTLPPLTTLVPSRFWFQNSARDDYQASIASCFLAAGEGVSFLMRAGVVLYDATRKCEAQFVATKGQKKCAVDILALLGVLNMAARFLSLTVPACAGTAILSGSRGQGAKCAAAITGVAGGALLATTPVVSFGLLCNPKIAGKPLSRIPRIGAGR